MRDLTDTLKNAQQAMTIDALVKIVLTRTGQTTRTYDRDRILDRDHPEEPYSQKAAVVLDNSDGALTNLALQGFEAVLSYGVITGAGEEYFACAPLWVIAQQFNSSPGVLDCTLELVGIPNLMAEDKASKNYIPGEDDTKTVKTLIREIAGDAGVTHLSCYNHCKKYDVVFDSEDDLLTNYKPKNGFRIYKNNSRLAVIKRLLDCTKCVMIAKADGKLHIFVPQITGTPVYTYSLESGHTFFASANRKTIIIPNYIYASSPPPTVPNWVIVTSPPYSGEAKDQADIDKFGERKHTTDFGAGNLESNAACAEYAQLELDRYIALHDPYYEGTAYDQESIDAIGEIRAYQQGSFENDTQAQQVAEAILAKYKLNAEMGAASVPMNVAQEVYDYINVVDTRQGKERAGTIGRLTRHYNALKGEWRMSFSFGQRPEAAVDIMPIVEQAAPYFGRLIVDNLYAQKILADSLDMVWIDPDGTIDLSKIGDNMDNLPDGEVYARVKTLHLDAGQIKLNENILYKAGYDPNTKRRNFTTTPTTPYDLGDLWHGASVVKRCTTARATGAYVAGDWTPVSLDQIGEGVTYKRVLSTHIEAGKIKLQASTVVTSGFTLDKVYEGVTFQRVRATDISAGHIKLTGYTVTDPDHRLITDDGLLKLAGIEEGADVTAGQSLSILTDRTLAFITDTTTRKAVSGAEKSGAGEAYNVFISKLTAYGLSLWTANSSTRVELTSAGLKGYSGGVLQVEIKSSDGKIYAGAGAVKIDATGINVDGEAIFFRYGSYIGEVYEDSEGLIIWTSHQDILLNPSTGVIICKTIRPFTTNYDLGTLTYHFDIGYIENINPSSVNVGNCGYSDKYWAQVCSYRVFSKDGEIHAFQKHDDIALLKAIKPRRHKGRDVIDAGSLPPVLLMPGDKGDKHGKFVNMGGLAGFNIGVMKQIVERLEALESKVSG